ncbi:PA14 domain-containing protein [Candidatus Amarolinea dominans]|uniref:PA14 domain-containing protein n=1 Tax=Candidatus Amarolinea dominans TaxID=3140696 RepID=UPI0031CC4234
MRADDGVRLWINGQPTIDQWHDSQSQTYTADVPLAAGAHSIKLEYYERSGGAMIEFSWKRIGNRSPIQPQISLAPAGSGQFTVTGSNWPTTTSSAAARPPRRAHSRRDHHPWRERQQFRRQQQRLRASK